MSHVSKVCEGVVRVFDTTNPEMDMIVMLFEDNDDGFADEVQEAFDSWYSDEAHAYGRGEWVREKLEENHDRESFMLFYSEDWDDEDG